MKQKSIYLIYDTVNCMPNGDPDSREQRYDEISKKAIVSDLRIKRFGRDMLNVLGMPVYYFYDKETIFVGDKSITGADARFNEYCEKNNIKIKNKKNKDGINAHTILLREFIDVRIFGGVLTAKENNAHVTGALQFDAENKTINDVLLGKNLINRGITTIFPSNDSNEQGSIGRDSYIRYGLFCIKGRFDATVAKLNGCSDKDLTLALTAIWNRIKTINTRSKFGHEPIACIVIEHPTKEVKNGFITNPFSISYNPFTIKTDCKLSDIYNRKDYEFDFTPLKDSVKNDKNVENVTIYCDNNDFIEKHFNDLPNNCKIVNPFDELLSLI